MLVNLRNKLLSRSCYSKGVDFFLARYMCISSRHLDDEVRISLGILMIFVMSNEEKSHEH